MTIKLNKRPKADDISVKMPLRLFRDGDVIKLKDGTECFIEYWSDSALQVKAELTRIGARLTRLNAIRERRTDRDWKLMSDQAIAKENEDYKNLTVDFLTIRTKSWLLGDTDGNQVEAPLTHELARELYGDDEHELMIVAQQWLQDNANLFLPTKSAN